MPIPSPLDIIAVIWFFYLWIGYNILADNNPLKRKSVFGIMQEYRSRWMKEMLKRDIRMLDTMILDHLQGGIGVFASTSILAIGGLIAILGASDKAELVLSAFPLADEPGGLKYEFKAVLLLMIFVYAFFKFVWSYRLYGFCAIMVGAVPNIKTLGTEAEDMAERAAQISSLAGRHQNRGLRAFYFALAALAWFIHPVAFMAAAAWVIMVLLRRDFHSRSQRIASGHYDASN